ncbi:MAG: sigma factor-like helix-turn-helix DNA-binding protein [Nocardioides sp.]
MAALGVGPRAGDRLALGHCAQGGPQPSPDQPSQEALLLIARDGLSASQAADVLGIKPAAFRKRLSRACAALNATDESFDLVPPTIAIQELT